MKAEKMLKLATGFEVTSETVSGGTFHTFPSVFYVLQHYMNGSVYLFLTIYETLISSKNVNHLYVIWIAYIFPC